MNKRSLIKSVLVLCALIAGFLILGAKSCTNRNNNTKTGSSNYNAFIINAPSGLVATVISSSQLDLLWSDNSNNEDGFAIERSLDGVSFQVLISINSNTISYSDETVSPFTTYYYRTRAFNTIGDNSDYSNIASAITIRAEWQSVAAGESHSLALNSNGTLWGWGDNRFGQLDPSNYVATFTIPAILNTAADWSTINSGYYHTVAIKNNLSLWAWGDNSYGQLGLGNTESYFIPMQVGINNDWSCIDSGEYFNIALNTNLTIWSWGLNRIQGTSTWGPGGQLGLGDTIDRSTPTQIGSDSDWVFSTAGGRHALAIKTNDTLWGWGWNNYSQLGIGDSGDPVLTPTQIGTDSDWAVVNAGFTHTMAVKTNNTLWGWGSTGDGVFNGPVIYVNTPAPIGNDSDWTAIRGINQSSIAVGGAVEIAQGGYVPFVYSHSFALKSNGTTWSWGSNDYGALGQGDTNVRSIPDQVFYPQKTWKSISSGSFHSIGLTADGSIWGWGRNDFYQLGLGISADQTFPININIPQPANLIATVISDTQVTLTWSDSSLTETGFIIERSLDGVSFQFLSSVETDITSYSDTGLNPETDYYYRIKTVFPDVNSIYSNISGGITRIWTPQIPLSMPAARNGHSMVWDLAGQKVILFGGYDGTNKNDLWWYEPTSGTNGTWIDKTTTAISPTARDEHSMVWDPVDQKVIMFGGHSGGTSYKNDLWWYDPVSGTNGAWIDKTTTAISPTARYGHAMVWDPIGQKVIMFGGRGSTPTYKNDWWWYDPIENTWIDKTTTSVSPTARCEHSMVWDPVGQKIIMFGAYNNNDWPYYRNDLWFYYPVTNTWIEQFTSSTPAERSRHSMVWDPVDQKIIMFGGYGNADSFYNDLWWYDPIENNWTEKKTNGLQDSPSLRQKHSMVWDPIRQKVIMFGGSGPSISYKSDVWWYDPVINNWEYKLLPSLPLGTATHSMVWDDVGQKVIMFGGGENYLVYKNDLWWYEPISNSWFELIVNNAPGSPSARHKHSMVWDSVGQKIIMFGGNTAAGYKNDLWWYDPISNTWTEKIANGAPGSPPARYGHSMVWDPVGQRVIMFGGNDGTYKNDWWWYDPLSGTNGAWIDMTTAAISPTARNGHSMIWDPIKQKVIMFGGYNDLDTSQWKNDLWEYNPISNTWTMKIANGKDDSPPARQLHSMVWDPIGQRVIMFGGRGDSNSVKNDLWWYDPVANSWTKQTPFISPSARQAHSMVWDTIGQKMIMFGGFDVNGLYKNDLWWWE